MKNKYTNSNEVIALIILILFCALVVYGVESLFHYSAKPGLFTR